MTRDLMTFCALGLVRKEGKKKRAEPAATDNAVQAPHEFESTAPACLTRNVGQKMNPRITESALDAIRPGWRQRRAKRKSLWNLLCVFLGFVIIPIVWYYLFQVAWYFHTTIYPEHISIKKDFWGASISAKAFISSFLMLMPLGIVALFSGFISANLIIWLIPPARRKMEAEAAGDEKMTFRGANAELIKWGSIASTICLVLSAIGLFTLSSLK
jgi:hypothetical protein